MLILLLHYGILFLRMQQSKGGQRITKRARRARCGRPTAATTEENIAHVHRVVMDDSRLFNCESVGISRGQVENILHIELGIWKISVRRAPRLLTPHQNLTWPRGYKTFFNAQLS